MERLAGGWREHSVPCGGARGPIAALAARVRVQQSAVSGLAASASSASPAGGASTPSHAAARGAHRGARARVRVQQERGLAASASTLENYAGDEECAETTWSASPAGGASTPSHAAARGAPSRRSRARWRPAECGLWTRMPQRRHWPLRGERNRGGDPAFHMERTAARSNRSAARDHDRPLLSAKRIRMSLGSRR